MTWFTFWFRSARHTYGLLLLGCALLMASALVMQEVFALKPCALCITQRLFVILVGVIALLALLHNPGPLGVRLYGGAGLLAAMAGAGFAGRHVWLQGLPPDQVPSCGPTLDYMFENFPFMQALELLLWGDGNCAEEAGRFLGLTIPGWTLVAFIGLALFCVFQILRKPS